LRGNGELTSASRGSSLVLSQAFNANGEKLTEEDLDDEVQKMAAEKCEAITE
jgi:hypothetical protein